MPNQHYKDYRVQQAQGMQITLAYLLAATQSSIDVDTHFLFPGFLLTSEATPARPRRDPLPASAATPTLLSTVRSGPTSSWIPEVFPATL